MAKPVIYMECGKLMTLRNVRKHVIEEHYTRDLILTMTDMLVVVNPK